MDIGPPVHELGLVIENPADHIRARVRLTNLKKKGAVNLSLDAQAKDDNVSTTLDWGNNAAATYLSLIHISLASPMKPHVLITAISPCGFSVS